MSRSTALGPRRYTPPQDRRTRASSETFADSSLAPGYAGERYSRRDQNARPIEVQSLRGPSPRPRTRPPSPKVQRVFKWVRGERIGEGSYGKVFMAMNATTGEVMAVKQVEKPTTEADRLKGNAQQLIKALLDESQTLRDLDHPNIVQYLGFEENLETLNIFLEYIPGGTIHSCLRRYGIFKDNVARSFTTQILQGLQYLHSRNIMHRDLKSENILVQPTGICKISDFGISKYSSGEGTRVHTAMKGTFHWMAPEVVDTSSSRSGYTNKIDIWSLGCVALEMWSAQRPWAGDNWFAVLFKVIQEKSFPPVPQGVYLSEIMEDFRKSCFQADPQLRPSAAALLGHPYLAIPADWEFPGMDAMGELPLSMVRRRHSPSEAPTGMDKFPVKEDDTVIASGTLKPLDPTLPSSRRPSLAVVTGVPGSNSIPPSDHPANISIPTDGAEGPPVVYITPPGSPRGRMADDDWLLGQATSSEPPPGKAKPIRRLVVHNPDDPTLTAGRNTPPVYNPPPLPPHTSSSRLDAAPKHSASMDSIGIHQRRPSASGSISHIHNPCQPLRGPSFEGPSRPPNGGAYPSTTTGTSVSFDSTGSSMWQVPPAGLGSRNQQAPTPKGFFAMAKQMVRRSSAASTSSSPAIVPPTSVIPAPGRASSPTPLPGSIATEDKHPPPEPRSMTRPAVEEVYENLNGFFPGHNLDEPIIESPIEPPSRGAPWDHREDNLLKRVTMKSIRNIAEEQHLQLEQLEAPNRRMARQTGLWDARVEEISRPRQVGEAVPNPLRANRLWS